jgi:transposase, IS30 family
MLSPSDREEIMIGLRQEKSIRSIATFIDRDPSVISREIQRNSTEDNLYQAYWAQKRSEKRHRSSRQRARIDDEVIRTYIKDNLKLGWSPEQIAGRIRIDLSGKVVSHETIYQYIFKKEPSLTQFLVCGRKKRRKRMNKRTKRVMIPHRTGIEERPCGANTRRELGHWEADTAVSRQSKEAIMVLHERKLGLTLIEKLPRCAPAEMNEAIVKRLSVFPKHSRRSITFDNGQENRYHMELRNLLGIATYFCNPYSSWEKGSVENAIGLTRRVWPKKTDYGLISQKDIATVEYRLNTRPRKRFSYLSPLEYSASVASTP